MSSYNILHYTVGLNRNRGGGLTKYVDDLISVQKQNNNIFLLYPGKINLINKTVRIKKERKENDINIYSIINPLPLPMLFGLKDYRYITKKTGTKIWKKFLIENKIEIIHMHTLMGIYEELLDAAIELDIPVLYTTHDYFGICPKQTLFYDGEICKCWENCENCPKCNISAMSRLKTYLIHTKVFTSLRKYSFFKIIKSREKNKIDTYKNNRLDKKYNQDYYIKLKEKMFDMFNKITYFHFNSSISSNVFKNALPHIKGEIINISHNNIKDNRKTRDFNSQQLRVTYLGPTTLYKGFFDIINSIDEIYKCNKNIILNIYSYTNIERPYINQHNEYQYSDLPKIFDETDIVIAPSKGLETFGFTVIEALSYGIPVIVSNSMGAKDAIIDQKTGYVVDNSEIANILALLMENRNILKDMNRNICFSEFKTFKEHVNDINLMYMKIKEKRV